MTKELHNELYQITFAGRILEGFSEAEVRENVQALFRISDERTASLFSGATKTCLLYTSELPTICSV